MDKIMIIVALIIVTAMAISDAIQEFDNDFYRYGNNIEFTEVIGTYA